MPGPFVHRIDPVLWDAGGVYLWWYGLGYALGFLNLHWWLRRNHGRIGLSPGEVYPLSFFIAVGVLAGGRFVEVFFDEWPFYREHPLLVPALWLGGMATHGLLLGALVAMWLFVRIYGKPFRTLADALVIPAAMLMGFGRLGNFIDGQIVGSPTDGWWGVKFPDSDGFRHPVVLYDGIKNVLLVPYLAHVRRTQAVAGATAARFVFWYPFLRLFIDLFRDYPTHRFEIGTGQTLNIGMTLIGVVLLVRSRMRRLGRLPAEVAPHAGSAASRVPPLVFLAAFAAVVLFCLTIPSNWTQDVPARYGKRHPGLRHSALYPPIDTAPRRTLYEPFALPAREPSHRLPVPSALTASPGHDELSFVRMCRAGAHVGTAGRSSVSMSVASHWRASALRHGSRDAALQASSSACRDGRSRARMASLINRLIPLAGSSYFRRSCTCSSIVMFSRTSIWVVPQSYFVRFSVAGEK